jgi:hypothetical protein
VLLLSLAQWSRGAIRCGFRPANEAAGSVRGVTFSPEVDVVIAVHDPGRPVLRAVNSVLDHNRASLRVTVVCHNTPESGIRNLLAAHTEDKRFRTLQLQDGIRSPAGPFNLGLASASARFTSVMGSDDELEPGAIDSWLAVADRDQASAVIARLRHARGRGIPTPPVRPGRVRKLDGVKDRLAYRSAPLGLVSTRAFGEERFVEGLSSGEDVAYVTAVWFAGERVSFDRHGPAYIVHDDAGDRVSMRTKPVDADLAFLKLLLIDPRFSRLAQAQRLATILKLLRVHIFGIVANRPDPGTWTAEDRRQLAEMTATLIALAPGAPNILSRADNALLSSIEDTDVPIERVLALSARRRRLLPASLLSADLRRSFDREAPFRMMAASVLVRGLP